MPNIRTDTEKTANGKNMSESRRARRAPNSAPPRLPLLLCAKQTAPLYRAVLPQVSELHRNITLHSKETVNRNPPRSRSQPPCMNSNLASHLHLCLKSIYVRNGIPLKIRSNTYVVGTRSFLFDSESTAVKFEIVSAERLTIYKG